MYGLHQANGCRETWEHQVLLIKSSNISSHFRSSSQASSIHFFISMHLYLALLFSCLLLILFSRQVINPFQHLFLSELTSNTASIGQTLSADISLSYRVFLALVFSLFTLYYFTIHRCVFSGNRYHFYCLITVSNGATLLLRTIASFTYYLPYPLIRNRNVACLLSRQPVGWLTNTQNIRWRGRGTV